MHISSRANRQGVEQEKWGEGDGKCAEQNGKKGRVAREEGDGRGELGEGGTAPAFRIAQGKV